MKDNSTTTSRRAALNVARLYSGELGEREARAANGWRESGERDREYQREFLASNHLLADIDPLMEDEELLRFADEPATGQIVKPGRWRIVTAAALLLIVTAIGWEFYPGNTNDWESTALRYVTRVGEQKTVNLDDGSVVTLNTGTQLIVNMTDSERRVILERGEAFFDVTSDSQLPFMVNAGLRTVTVLGTQFNVRVYPEKLQVAVMEGMVALHPEQQQVSEKALLIESRESDDVILPKPGQVRVKAGWVVELDSGNQKLLGYSASKLSNLSAWRSGQLEFAGLPLRRVVQELNRYSRKKILIEDTTINELKIFAVVKISRMDLALDGLENTLPVKVTDYFDRIVLTGK